VRLSAEFGGAGVQLAEAGHEPMLATKSVLRGSGGSPRCEIGVQAARVRKESRAAFRLRRIVAALRCG
jgi:hypothetical protein